MTYFIISLIYFIYFLNFIFKSRRPYKFHMNIYLIFEYGIFAGRSLHDLFDKFDDFLLML